MEDILDTLSELWIKVYTPVQQDIPLDWFFIGKTCLTKAG
jgi:hypothetical protein